VSGQLRVKGLGKAYRRWKSEWLRAASWFGVPVRASEEHWVLRDVGFEIGPGQTVGVVGQNGAGKSTLLKIITGTTQPTEGSVERVGRVAAILELGMGFNPDLSGRENAAHSSGLMGYTQEEIEAAMPEIESFSEIGEYFDQPVRTYSSGMQMRVAFAVATAYRPDLLIVDEALSVGDSYFQHKSFDRIRQFREEGMSIMLVTHSMGDVRTLCDRVILLDKGRVLKDGLPDEVVDYYNAMVSEKENQKLDIEQRRSKSGWLLTRSGSGEVRVESLQLHDAETGAEIAVARVGQRVELRLLAKAHEALPRLVLGFMLRDKQGHVVWGTNTWHTRQVQDNVRAGETLEFRLAFTCTLGPGSYSVSPALVSSDTHLSDNYEWVDNLLVFDVVNTERPLFIGSSWLDAEFDITRRGDAAQ
jgi:lipopolysaccharide transport system ATP-binding protein